MNDAVSLPTQEKLMLATVQAIRALGGSAKVYEITDSVINILGLSKAQQGGAAKDEHRTWLKYRLAWARTALKTNGILKNSSRGVWSLASYDESTAEKNIQEILFAAETANRIPQPHNNQDGSQNADEGRISDYEAGDDWKQNLLEVLLKIEPRAFERLCQRLLRESGFESVEVTKRSGDGGIDGVGVLQVNLVTFRVVFECKRYSNSVGSPIIQAFRGAMDGRGEKGLVITTASFTSGAREEATRPGALSIDLVDGDRLCDLLKNLSLGVSTEMVERVNIDHEWFLRV